MQTLSVKQLREALPKVRKALKNGQTFLVIYKSLPIAKLIPVDPSISLEEATDADIENAAIEDWGDEFLNEEEINYYMSLPDYDKR